MIDRFDIVSDVTLGEGGFLQIRRLKLRLVRSDGTHTAVGTYDFVERPKGLDAVVLALWTRAPSGEVQVLIREGLRVPLSFGRPEGQGRPVFFAELVAGILEAGEESPAQIRARAAAEAWEEAGLRVAESAIVPLGHPVHPTPGMCAEIFHLCAAEVAWADAQNAHPPPGDGSPFEEGARQRWVPLREALAQCARGEITDLKTEVLLRRLSAAL